MLHLEPQSLTFHNNFEFSLNKRRLCYIHLCAVLNSYLILDRSHSIASEFLVFMKEPIIELLFHCIHWTNGVSIGNHQYQYINQPIYHSFQLQQLKPGLHFIRAISYIRLYPESISYTRNIILNRYYLYNIPTCMEKCFHW